MMIFIVFFLSSNHFMLIISIHSFYLINYRLILLINIEFGEIVGWFCCLCLCNNLNDEAIA